MIFRFPYRALPTIKSAAMLIRRIEMSLIKFAVWVGAVVLLLQLIVSERKRQEWQRAIERLDAANRELELVEIPPVNAKRPDLYR
jgi:hypothetical protein